MRPVAKTDTPQAHPHKCINCGHGKGPYRRWFVDLGFDISNEYMAVYDGAVYLCNECVPNLIDSLLLIVHEDREAVMDNRLLKEETSYGLMDRIAGGSELPDIRHGEPIPPVFRTTTDRGTVQGMDNPENLPDTGNDSSAPESVRHDDETDGSNISADKSDKRPAIISFGNAGRTD